MEGGCVKQSTSQYFDKRLCLEALKDTQEALEGILARTNFHYPVSFRDPKSGGPSAPLEDLEAIAFQELVVDHVHRGRVLYGRLCANPLMLAAVHTVLEDEQGNGVPLAIYNAVPSTASSDEIEAQFPMGLKVAIKEPYFKQAADGRASIRVDNPADVVHVLNCQDVVGGSHAVVELLQAIRVQGNKLFGQQNWFGAVAKYSECIDEGEAWESQGCGRSQRLNDVMKLAYSNRAETQLRLQNFDGALSDAKNALKLDSTHMKSMDRKGRAAMGLGLYEQVIEAFAPLLKQCPDEMSRLQDLVHRDLEESKTADPLFLKKHPETADPLFMKKCPETVGPVEIRRVTYSDGGRGLFVTEAIKASTDLLMSNAMVVDSARGNAKREQGVEEGYGQVAFKNCTMRVQATHGLMGIIGLGDARMIYHKFTTNFDSSGGMFGPMYKEDAIVRLVQRVKASKRSMAQVYSIQSGNDQDLELPSMELFKPESEWIPPCASSLALDVNRLYEIMSSNAFEVESLKKDFNTSANSWIRSDGRWQRSAPIQGLWILPSFINHSCAPNTVHLDLGFVKKFRAIVDIDCDQELTFTYVNVFASFEERQEKLLELKFNCECQRCLLEKRLQPVFSAISAEVESLLSGSRSECLSGTPTDERFLVTKQLATQADRLEALIHRLGTEITTHQQNWVRASFLDAYLAKYVVAAVCEPSASVRIETLIVMVESIISVLPSPDAETFAHLLYDEVKTQHRRNSKVYKRSQELVQRFLRRLYNDTESSLILKQWGEENETFDYGSFTFRRS